MLSFLQPEYQKQANENLAIFCEALAKRTTANQQKKLEPTHDEQKKSCQGLITAAERCIDVTTAKIKEQTLLLKEFKIKIETQRKIEKYAEVTKLIKSHDKILAVLSSQRGFIKIQLKTISKNKAKLDDLTKELDKPSEELDTLTNQLMETVPGLFSDPKLDLKVTNLPEALEEILKTNGASQYATNKIDMDLWKEFFNSSAALLIRLNSVLRDVDNQASSISDATIQPLLGPTNVGHLVHVLEKLSQAEKKYFSTPGGLLLDPDKLKTQLELAADKITHLLRHELRYLDPTSAINIKRFLFLFAASFLGDGIDSTAIMIISATFAYLALSYHSREIEKVLRPDASTTGSHDCLAFILFEPVTMVLLAIGHYAVMTTALTDSPSETSTGSSVIISLIAVMVLTALKKKAAILTRPEDDESTPKVKSSSTESALAELKKKAAILTHPEDDESTPKVKSSSTESALAELAQCLGDLTELAQCLKEITSRDHLLCSKEPRRHQGTFVPKASCLAEHPAAQELMAILAHVLLLPAPILPGEMPSILMPSILVILHVLSMAASFLSKNKNTLSKIIDHFIYVSVLSGMSSHLFPEGPEERSMPVFQVAAHVAVKTQQLSILINLFSAAMYKESFKSYTAISDISALVYQIMLTYYSNQRPVFLTVILADWAIKAILSYRVTAAVLADTERRAKKVVVPSFFGGDVVVVESNTPSNKCKQKNA